MNNLYAKIMLFGEYSLMFGSSALTIPFHKFGGYFDYSKDLRGKGLESNLVLKKFLRFISLESENITLNIDFKSFQSDIENGLFFYSTIPAGYGLGSSGALVAAVFGKYSSISESIAYDNGYSELQKDLGLAESFFHGKSSGIDPFSIFIGKPLRIDQKITILSEKDIDRKILGNFYLFDTGILATTKTMVDTFTNKTKEQIFRTKLENQLIPAVNRGIQSVIDGNFDSLKTDMKTVSDFQFTYQKETIPVQIQDIWKEGMDSGDYFFKLCGSGGGGYMLIYSEIKKEVLEEKINSKLLSI